MSRSSTRLTRLCRKIDVTAIPEASTPHPTSSSIAATKLTRSGSARNGGMTM